MNKIEIYHKLKIQWSKYGKRFGYPNCCIESFTKNSRPSRIQLRVSNNTGFIPCSYCCWKILSKKCKLEDLIKDRKQRTQFPNTGYVSYFRRLYNKRKNC